jgi:hypothetical protein
VPKLSGHHLNRQPLPQNKSGIKPSPRLAKRPSGSSMPRAETSQFPKKCRQTFHHSACSQGLMRTAWYILPNRLWPFTSWVMRTLILGLAQCDPRDGRVGRVIPG